MSAKTNHHGRIVFDVSSMLRMTGTMVGMVRVQRELANWARYNITNINFVFFDPDLQIYRGLSNAFSGALICGQATIDLMGLTDPARPGQRRTDRIPHAIKPFALWVVRFPHKLLRMLERIRLASRNRIILTIIDKLQQPLMSSKQRTIMVAKDGRRRPYLPIDLACGRAFEFNSDDTLVCAGAGWLDTNIRVIRRLKNQIGVQVVLLCYDMIPLLYPHFYKPHDVAAFRDYYQLVLSFADLIIFTSFAVERDARTYCAHHAIAIGRTVVTQLGADSVARCGDAGLNLPAGLERNKFVLFVSTIEPRKGHRLLHRAWLRLLADGTPQQFGFKLVFVGRSGWMMDDFLRTLKVDSRITNSLQLIPTADDKMLACLYQNAAFCVYPSVYEGYGLPVVEAFFYGKAVLSSNAGALCEVVGDYSPCLDPEDAELWYRMLKSWIEDPLQREPYESAIRSRFRHPRWTEAAAQFFAIVEENAASRSNLSHDART
jgi:glycosyltransferase involved in cell wall biosynthesis